MNGVLQFLLEVALCVSAQETEEMSLSHPMPMIVADKTALQQEHCRLFNELYLQQNSGNFDNLKVSELSEALVKVESKLSHHE